MFGNIVKRFEWPLVKKALYTSSPFTIYHLPWPTTVQAVYSVRCGAVVVQADQSDLGCVARS